MGKMHPVVTLLVWTIKLCPLGQNLISYIFKLQSIVTFPFENSQNVFQICNIHNFAGIKAALH